MEVLLIRHAQANWGGDDYDQLSGLGTQQARALGQWIAQMQDAPPDAWICGPRRRHRLTLEAIHAASVAAGLHPAPIHVDRDWDDSDAAALLAAFRHACPEAPELAWVAPGATPPQARALLAAVFSAWRAGRLDEAMPETWKDFGTRIARARANLASGAHRRVLVVSSAGAIARCAQAALGLDDDAMVALNVRLSNASISTFDVDEGRWHLQRWNCQPHFANSNTRTLASTH